jgi:hypothetical protein
MRVRQGQLISFGTVSDEDWALARWVWVPVRKHDTVRKIASRRRHEDLAQTIADANGIRHVNSKLGRKQLRVPAILLESTGFDVLAGPKPPRIVGGYGKVSTIDRPNRSGLSKFDGYDPISMEVQVQFERLRNSGGVLTGVDDVERDIAKLERMAGRGQFQGAATGPTPVITVTTTRNVDGAPVPLIPLAYQRTLNNKTGPVWRVSNIDWDADPLRDDDGKRYRQLATITLTQVVNVQAATRLVARAKAKKKPKKKPRH